jgi:hypothetical protein
MFAGKAGKACQAQTLKLIAKIRDKHSSLLRKSVNYGGKKHYSTGPWTQWDKKFMAVIYECL